jgi:EmrB/QacA subfamily drug resistance transporter
MAITTSASAPSEKLSPEIIRVGVVVILGTIMAILDSTIVAVAIPRLAGDFHETIGTIQWVTTGYLLSLAIVIPLSGWGVHRFGAKPVYMGSLFLFIVGSALCGVAWSAPVLIVFRVVQGFGGGMIMPVGQTIMARTAGPQRMTRVMALIGVPTLLGPILGPVIGGIIVSNTTWRWIFFVNVPIGIVALVLAMRQLPSTPPDRGHRLDLPGFLALAPGLALLVYGLSEVGITGSFSSATVLVSSIGGMLLIGAFVMRSLRAPEPLMDLRLMKRPTFSVASICIFLTGAALYGNMFLLPIYYQFVRGQGAWVAGLLMAPQGIGAALVMQPAAKLADRYGTRRTVPFGMALLALGTIVYTQVSGTTSFALLGVFLFIRGIGLGFSMMPVFAAAYRGLTHDQVPRASTSTNIIRQVGGSIGVAAFAVVLQRSLASKFPNQKFSFGNLNVHLSPPVINQIAGAFGTAFWWSFWMCAIAIIPSFFLPGSLPGEAGIIATVEDGEGEILEEIGEPAAD